MFDKDVEISKVSPYIRVKQAMELFAFDRVELLKLLNAREIRASKNGKCWKISTVSIMRYLKRHENRRLTL